MCGTQQALIVAKISAISWHKQGLHPLSALEVLWLSLPFLREILTSEEIRNPGRDFFGPTANTIVEGAKASESEVSTKGFQLDSMRTCSRRLDVMQNEVSPSSRRSVSEPAAHHARKLELFLHKTPATCEGKKKSEPTGGLLAVFMLPHDPQT